MTEYSMVEHKAFIAAMEQLIQNYEAKRGTKQCALCTAASKVAQSKDNFCLVCPWQIITAEGCIFRKYYELEPNSRFRIGFARKNPTKYPTIVAIRVKELREWIKLYRADLAKQ